MKKKIKSLIISMFVISLIFLGVNYNGVNRVGAASPLTVDLGTASNFSILAKTAITTTGATSIVGNIGVSPAAASTMTGFSLVMDSSNIFSTSNKVTGKVYASDYSVPTPANMTITIADMMSAYNDVAGRPDPTATELGSGILNSSTPAFLAGIYKWSTGVTITDSITLSGDASDVWIFQISGDLNLASAGSVASGTKILLTGGAKADNVFWQVGGLTGATLGTYSTFNGNILSAKQIIMQTGTVFNGRALSQTQVTLDANTISSSPATLHIIKVVVNDVDGVAIPSSFSLSVKKSNINVAGSPMSGTSTPGALYSLAPGTYVVDEAANSSYTKSFSGDCSATGTVVLLAGDDKTCTITNTSIAVVPPSSGAPTPSTPQIGITKTPNFWALSKSGLVTYNYTVWNISKQQSLASVVVVDDKCSPVTLVSGDLNKNFKIEASEIWKYSCVTSLYRTTTNTATATAKSDDPYQQVTTAVAVATVTVDSFTTPVVISTTTTPVIVEETTNTTTIISTSTTSTSTSLISVLVPKLPNTGMKGIDVSNVPWYFVGGISAIGFLAIVYFIGRKYPI